MIITKIVQIVGISKTRLIDPDGICLALCIRDMPDIIAATISKYVFNLPDTFWQKISIGNTRQQPCRLYLRIRLHFAVKAEKSQAQFPGLRYGEICYCRKALNWTDDGQNPLSFIAPCCSGSSKEVRQKTVSYSL